MLVGGFKCYDYWWFNGKIELLKVKEKMLDYKAL
jgi:hypothetical protein